MNVSRQPSTNACPQRPSRRPVLAQLSIRGFGVAIALALIAVAASQVIATASPGASPGAAPPAEDVSTIGDERWFRVPYVPRELNAVQREIQIDTLKQQIDTAKQSGYSTILISDTFINRLERPPAGSIGRLLYDTWHTTLETIVDHAKREPTPLKVVLQIASFGRCKASLLINDPQLAAGHKLDVPLQLDASFLQPISTGGQGITLIRNGGFEDYNGATFAHFGRHHHDDVTQGPGYQGGGSAQIMHDNNGRIVRGANLGQSIEVGAFEQFRLSVRVKTNQLQAQHITMRVRGADGRSLTSLPMKIEDKYIQHGSEGDGVTIDWTTYEIAFNSGANTEVEVFVAVDGLRKGWVRFDDLSIRSTPTLNLLARPGLVNTETPDYFSSYIEVTEPGGFTWKARAGFMYDLVDANGNIVDGDPDLSDFDVSHEPPRIRATGGLARLVPGREMRLNGYHAFVHFHGNVTCSWNAPGAFDLVRRIAARAVTVGAEGLVVPHDEIRSGGWEPLDAPNADDASVGLQRNIAGIFSAAREGAPGLPLHMYYDMIDAPGANPIANNYHIRTRLGQRLDVPNDVTVIAWDDKPERHGGNNSDVVAVRTKILTSMTDAAQRVLIASYYDTNDVALDRDLWAQAIAATPRSDRLGGVMYATWVGSGNFADLEAFATRWFTQPPAIAPPPIRDAVFESRAGRTQIALFWGTYSPPRQVTGSIVEIATNGGPWLVSVDTAWPASDGWLVWNTGARGSIPVSRNNDYDIRIRWKLEGGQLTDWSPIIRLS